MDEEECPRAVPWWELGVGSAAGGGALLGARECGGGDLFLEFRFANWGGVVIGVVDEVVVVCVVPLDQGAWSWSEEGALRLNVVGTGVGRDALCKRGDLLGIRSSSVGLFTRGRKRKLLNREWGRGEMASTGCGGA